MGAHIRGRLYLGVYGMFCKLISFTIHLYITYKEIN